MAYPNHEAVVREAERRLQNAQAAAAKKKAALAVVLKAKQQEQKAAAKALKAAKLASQAPA
jgi:tRNA nucleotidyltransferase (CCA-adding enzyme)